jgi:hypothetical protein
MKQITPVAILRRIYIGRALPKQISPLVFRPCSAARVKFIALSIAPKLGLDVAVGFEDEAEVGE